MPLNRPIGQDRWLLAFTTLSAIFFILLAAFVRLQILQSSEFRLRSEQNRVRMVSIPAPRGLILDRRGGVLAENIPQYEVALDWTIWKGDGPALDTLAAYLDRSRGWIEGRVSRSPDWRVRPVVVAKGADFGVVSRLEEHRRYFPGLRIQPRPARRYPYGQALAHVLGYVGEISGPELAKPQWTSYRAGDEMGKAGVEGAWQEVLRGKAGVKYVEVDAAGREVGLLRGQPIRQPVPGQPLVLTLDLDLQLEAARSFPKDLAGAVVAMDPRTGDLLAMYSQPTFDPNLLVGGLDRATWERQTRDPARPLFNRAVQALYPPGSAFKPVTAMAALNLGIVDFQTPGPRVCSGGMRFGRRYFRCWKAEGHGLLTLTDAIAQSCDVFFYQLGIGMGLERFLAQVSQLGLDRPTGLDLPQEVGGIVPTSTGWFDRRYGSRGWGRGVVLNLAIGQGEISLSPLHLAYFYSAIAGDGRPVPPRLVRGEGRPEVGLWRLAPEHVAGLREALDRAVNAPKGTARWLTVRYPHLDLAGKTGTAENPHGPDHGWFVGYGPRESPQIVVAAVVEFGVHGSTSAAPLVARLIDYYLNGQSPVRIPRIAATAEGE